MRDDPLLPPDIVAAGKQLLEDEHTKHRAHFERLGVIVDYATLQGLCPEAQSMFDELTQAELMACILSFQHQELIIDTEDMALSYWSFTENESHPWSNGETNAVIKFKKYFASRPEEKFAEMRYFTIPSYAYHDQLSRYENLQARQEIGSKLALDRDLQGKAFRVRFPNISRVVCKGDACDSEFHCSP